MQHNEAQPVAWEIMQGDYLAGSFCHNATLSTTLCIMTGPQRTRSTVNLLVRSFLSCECYNIFMHHSLTAVQLSPVC